jgi:hypothetical protein
VKYVAPNPEKPMEEYEAIPNIERIDENLNVTISGDEMLCQ